MRYLALILAIFVGIAAYTVFWFHVKSEAEVNIAAWLQHRRAAGDTVKYSALDIGGYPFRIEVSISKPVFGRVSGSRSWTIEGDKLRVIAAPWNLDHVVAYHEGPFEIHYHSVTANGKERRIDLTGTTEAAGASSIWKHGAWNHADAEFSGLSLTEKDAKAPLTAGHVEFHVRLLHPGAPDEPGGIDQPARSEYALEASDISFPGAPEQPLGSMIQTLNAIIEVHGDKPIGRTIPEIEAWRDAGGTLDVKPIKLDWGPLKVMLNGSIALDESNRPVGAMTAEFTDYDKLIDAISGPDAKGEGPGLKKFLDSLVKASGQPKNTLSLPFSMQDGDLYLGPIPVAKLPPVIGSEAPPAPPAASPAPSTK